MGGLAGTFARSVDDDMPAFFADEIGSLGGILEAVDGGLLCELQVFDGAVSSFHGDSFCAGIDFLDRTADDVGRLLTTGHRESVPGRQDTQVCPEVTS